MTTNAFRDATVGANVQARDIGAVYLHTPPQTTVVPRQLPPLSAAWTNRNAELHHLEETYAACPPYASTLVVITGHGGVGKSALAARWLHQHREETSGGQLYVDLRGHQNNPAPAATATIMRRLLHALGHTASAHDLGELTALWRSVTGSRRVGLLLDNARDADQIRPLLPGGNGHLITVTARRPIPDLLAEGAHSLPLGPFAPATSTQLLARLLGTTRVHGQLSAAERLSEHCGHLPLALCIAATRLAGRPHASLATAAVSLAHHHTPEEGNSSVTSAVTASYGDLPDTTARVYRRLALLPQPATLDLHSCAAALDLPWNQTAWELDTLTEARLLEHLDTQADQGGPGRTFRFHDEVCHHAVQRAAEEETELTRREVLRRWLDWLLNTATRAERLLTPAHLPLDRDMIYPPQVPPPFTSDIGALKWLTAHQSDFAAGVTTAEEYGWDSLVWQLPHSAWPLFNLVRPLELWLDLHERGLAATRRCGHREAERDMLTTGAIGLRGLNRHPEAIEWSSAALISARQDQDRRAESQALHEIGVAHQALDERELASTVLHEALAIREEIQYWRGAALTRLILGLVELGEDRTTQATDYLAVAQRVLTEEGDRFNAARAQAWLGLAYARRDDHTTAEDLLNQALAEFNAVGALPWQGRSLEMLGQVAEDQQQHHQARHLYTQALEIVATTSPKDAPRIRGRLSALPTETPQQDA